jgi:hypothetical protein
MIFGNCVMILQNLQITAEQSLHLGLYKIFFVVHTGRHPCENIKVIYVVDVSDRTLNSNMTSFFRFVNKRAIYRLGIISLTHAPVHVTDFPVVNVPVHELSSAQIWQHKLCATLSAHVNINYRLPIKVYYRICTLRHIRIIFPNFHIQNWLHGHARERPIT